MTIGHFIFRLDDNRGSGHLSPPSSLLVDFGFWWGLEGSVSQRAKTSDASAAAMPKVKILQTSHEPLI